MGGALPRNAVRRPRGVRRRAHDAGAQLAPGTEECSRTFGGGFAGGKEPRSQ